MPVRPNAALVQTPDGPLQEHAVLKAAAAQANAIQMALLAYFLRQLHKNGSEPSMETAADVTDALLTKNILQQALENSARADLPMCAVRNKSERISAAVSGIVCRHFKLNGCLGFVIDR